MASAFTEIQKEKIRRFVAVRLRIARRKSNLNQLDVQRRVGISQSQLSKYERGKKEVIDILTLTELAKNYNRDLEYFFPVAFARKLDIRIKNLTKEELEEFKQLG